VDVQPEELVEQAIKARQCAYAPYSNFQVGSALLTASGKIFTGCNVENASYGLTVCAERVAILKAVSEGETAIRALAAVSEPGASMCGACRQVLSEFGEEIPVYLADVAGKYRTVSIKDLLPGAFGGEFLRG
jgi:cytidine deaminase